MTVSGYFFIAISALVSLLFILRAIRLIFNEKILDFKIFYFPDSKYYKIGYCLCVSTLLIVAIYLRIYD